MNHSWLILIYAKNLYNIARWFLLKHISQLQNLSEIYKNVRVIGEGHFEQLMSATFIYFIGHSIKLPKKVNCQGY